MHLRIFSVAIILLAAALPGCQAEKALPPYQGSGTTPAADPGTITPLDTAPTATQTVAPTTTPTAMPPPGVVLASTEGEVPGIRIDITELKRTSGGALSLKFVIANNGEGARGFGDHWLGDGNFSGDYYAVGGVHLVDPINKKKYFVVRDAENVCMCSRELSSLQPGSKMNLWARFPAPPAEVQRVTVVVPHFAPMDDVPIS